MRSHGSLVSASGPPAWRCLCPPWVGAVRLAWRLLGALPRPTGLLQAASLEAGSPTPPNPQTLGAVFTGESHRRPFLSDHFGRRVLQRDPESG